MSGVSGGIFRRRPFSDATPAGPGLRATGVSPTTDESFFLKEFAESCGTVLEVGTAWGYSAILMALAGAMVWTVDPHTDLGTWEEFQRNLDDYKVRDRIQVAKAYSQEVLPLYFQEGGKFDGAFIDGDHSYEGCRHDLEWALKLVKPGGLLAAHDYTVRWAGVKQACDELLRPYETRRQVETLLVVRLDPPGGPLTWS
jgi:predicted O-methyltransferase YrrM